MRAALLCLSLILYAPFVQADAARRCADYWPEAKRGAPPSSVRGLAPHRLAPWAALFRFSYVDHEGNYIAAERCSGAVVAPNWVLTARHCVDAHRWEQAWIETGGAEVGINGNGIIIPVETGFCPEDTLPGNLARDVALLRLTQPIPSEVPAMKFATHQQVQTARRPFLAGWPYNNAQAKPSPLLIKQMVIEQASRDALIANRRNLREYSPCSGESGSILAEGTHALAILSAIMDPGRPGQPLMCDSPTMVGLFTNLANESAWIAHVIKTCERDPKGCFTPE